MINLQRASSAAIGLRQLGCGTSVQLQPAGGAKIKLASTEGGSSVLVGLSSHGPQIKVQNTGFKVALQPAAASQLIRVKIGLAQAGPPGPAGGGAAVHPIDRAFLRNPDGTLSRVNYSDGTYKTFEWTAGLLTSMVLYEAARTIQTTYNYDGSGLLLGSDEVLL
jgi:YD repeat-containing protein